MPHLGTQPPTGFKTTTKQSFSGDNSTVAFTLNRASSSETDLEVFVDNIQQEPTTAYSVSGTTLTFTEAPPTGTNNIYVVNRGGDQNGLLPPQDLGTTDYIFGDDISLNSDGAIVNMGADSEIKITHVADTGILLTDSGGSPTLQLHDSNESVSSDGSNLILTSGGTAFTLPTSDGTSGQALTTNASGVLSFATVSSTLTGIDDQSSSNDDQLTIKDGEVVINEDSDDLDFRVESNGDANMFFVDGGNDRIYMGRNVTDGVGNARLQIEAQDGEAGLSIHRGSASTGGGKIFFSKSRAATAGDDTVVQSGDQLGALLFTGADGTDRESAGAEISVEVDGTPGSNDMPGRIVFATTADGAASTTERMRIDSSGNVLIGLTSAASNNNTISTFQIEGTSSEAASMSIFRNGANANGAPLFLGKSRGSSVGDNTVVQNGDELGKILFVAADGTDRVSLSGAISCAIDEAPGANDTPGRLVFSTTGNSANNISERMRLSESGNLSIGTTTTDNARLDVRTSSSNEAACKFTADSTADVAGVIIKHDRVDGGDTGIIMNFQKQNGGSGGSITMTTSATTYNTSSDYRLKENVVTDWDATTRLKQLKPSRFNFIEAKDRTMDGFLAHEVSSIVPTAIVGEKDAVEKDGSIKPQGIDLSQLVPLVTKSLQEALARIDTLEAEVKTLKEG